MTIHSLDPTALIIGLLYALSGLAIVANSQWDDIDITAFTAAGATVVGLLLVVMIIARLLRDTSESSPKEP